MPKNKTHSGAKKRFRLTGSGKIMREQTHNTHLFEKKSRRRVRRLSLDAAAHPADVRRIKRMLGK